MKTIPKKPEFSTINGEDWDEEWAKDWQIITEIYGTIDKLKWLFEELDVSYLRKLSQKSLVLNLKKYAWSLKGYITEKYGDVLPDCDILEDNF